jgi:hypothetical protein
LHLLSVEMDSVLPKTFFWAQRVIKLSMLDANTLYLLAEIHYLFCCEFFNFILCLVQGGTSIGKKYDFFVNAISRGLTN